MSAKSELLERVRYIKNALEIYRITDIPISDENSDIHNGVANLLRKGLGIVAFNILEDFIKNKTEEVLEQLSPLIPFESLPQALQDSGIDALKALSLRANILKINGGDYKGLIVNEVLKIGSIQSPEYKLSKYSFFHNNSNISIHDINHLLKSFGVTGGWTLLKQISDAIYGGVVDLCEAYKNMERLRHKAAHSASFLYEYSVLSNIYSEIISISASFDIVLNAKLRKLKRLGEFTEKDTLTEELAYRFLVKEDGFYKYKTRLNGRSIKNWDSLNLALEYYNAEYRYKNKFFIIIIENNRLVDWYF